MVGRISQQEFAEVEQRLRVAEARGDAVVLARANLTLADNTLKVAKQKVAVGTLSPNDLKFMESQRAIAELELNEALKATKATGAAPLIRFTFTGVELREVEGVRWLAMDYAAQVHGDCEQTFRYEAKGLNFSAQKYIKEVRSEAKAGFAPVRYQQVGWRLPGSLAQNDSLALRDRVAKMWMGQSVTVEPGGERVLFKAAVPDGGTLAGVVEVKLGKARP